MRFIILLVSAAVAAAAPLPLQQVEDLAAQIDGALGQSLAGSDKELAPAIDDATFVRRAFLVINGRIPTPEEACAFLDSELESKRVDLIETLSGSVGETGHLFNLWADLLRLHVDRFEHGIGWREFIYKSIESDLAYDKFVREMLTATEHAADNPAAGYYLRDRGMLLDNVSNTAQVFLGRQIGCAQCHDHPFDDFSQREYYELASFSGGFTYNSREANDAIRRAIDIVHPDRNEKNRKERRALNRDLRDVFRFENRNALWDNPKRNLKYPHDYQYRDAKPGEVVKPRFYEGRVPEDMTPAERLEVFADWVTSPENAYFTGVISNRLWKHVFGRGLVEPVDDWSFDTEAMHPAVLEALASTMKIVDYRQREFLRVLYHTQLFQSEMQAAPEGEAEDFAFTAPVLRRMSAEQLHDSLLTLAYGNVDDDVTTDFARRWNVYVSQTQQLFASSGETVLAMNDSIDSARDEAREMRTALREKRKRAQKLGKQGKKQESRKLYAEVNEMQREARQLERFGRNHDQAMMAMTTPAMMMDTTEVKGKERRQMRKRRAAQQPSPFNRGHLIAQFGGSDRNTPSSAHTEPSIPQMLTLLNGQPQHQTLRKDSYYRSELDQLGTAEERLEHIFLSFYGTRPTSGEIHAFSADLQRKGQTYDFTRAVLTSRRFLFIQ